MVAFSGISSSLATASLFPLGFRRKILERKQPDTSQESSPYNIYSPLNLSVTLITSGGGEKL